MGLRDNKGIILIVAYVAIVVIMILGSAFFWRAFNENRLVLRHKLSAQALCIAEAGIERAISDLLADFQNSTSWADTDINGNVCGPNTAAYYNIPYPPAVTNFGGGTFAASLQNVPDVAGPMADQIWIHSTGTIEGVSRTLEVYLKMEEVNIWNNAVFAGTGASGALVNGNVTIRGSVHLLGDNLPSDTAIALDLGGGARIGNNYKGIPGGFSSRIPSIVNAQGVETLGAKLRVRRGAVGINSAASRVGDPDVTGDPYKDLMDGTYVTYGYTGTHPDEVYSDNGKKNVYDLGNKMSMPSLSGPKDPYVTYMDYLKAQPNTIIINNASYPGSISTLSSLKPDSSFNYEKIDVAGNTVAKIKMDGSGNLEVKGIIYIDGDMSGKSLSITKKGGVNTVWYDGKASIVATGNVEISVNLLTNGGINSYPSNIIGVMTPGNILFNEANIDVMGIFYGESKITSMKQTEVAGTFVSNYFDMGSNVPSIFQVPSIVRNLPPGMIGSDSIWLSVVAVWREV